MEFARLMATALVMASLFCPPALALPQDQLAPADAKEDRAPDLVDESEEFLRARAEIRHVELGNRLMREISIGGLRVNDLQLAQAVGDRPLVAKLEHEIMGARFWQGAISALTIPAGGYLLFISNQRLNISRATQQADALAFVLGAVGGITAIFGVTNLIPLINDMAGLTNPTLLSERQASDLVRQYNDRLRSELLRQSLGGNQVIARGELPLASLSFTF